MRIAFRKLSDERHRLEIVRQDGSHEEVECETRSYLLHDFLHHAVESEARLETGFWGRLAAGSTLAQMNDREMRALEGVDPELAAVEQIVGALHGATKGRTAAELVAGMQRFAASLEATLPGWLTEGFIVAVQERMRRLTGHWRGTAYGEAMEIEWV